MMFKWQNGLRYSVPLVEMVKNFIYEMSELSTRQIPLRVQVNLFSTQTSGELMDLAEKIFSIEMRPPRLYIWEDRGRMSSNPTSQTITNILLFFTLLFHLLSLPTFDGHWLNDSKALERKGWLGKPIAVTHPDGVPPGLVVFRVSRDLTGVSCVSWSPRGSSSNVSCTPRSSSEAQNKCSFANTLLYDGLL